MTVPALSSPDPARIRHITGFFGAIGRVSRARASFALTICALGFGVLRETFLPSSWRRPVRVEFVRALRQTVAGGLTTTMVAAALLGVAMVYQALFWLGAAGEAQLIGSILVTILVREVTPLIVGLIVLGRSGMPAAAEIGALQLGGQIHLLEAQGVDPFLLLVLPRAVALAVGSYTLGVAFTLTALMIGFMVGALAGGPAMSLGEFLSTILGAMQPQDFVIFPAKMLLIGLLVALTSTLTGWTIGPAVEPGRLLPLAFVRGTLAILVTSVSLSLAI